MIKLQIVIPTLDQSGAEKQFALLASRLPKSEFDVHVLALSRGGPYEKLLREQDVPFTILKKRWRFDPLSVLEVRRHLQSHRPDVVLSCLFSGNTTVRLATLGMRERPLTIISERCVDSWKSGWQLWIDRQLQSRTDRLVANSRSVAEFYRGLGFPSERMTVIPNGVAVPSQPEISREEFLAQAGCPPNARLVAYVGRLAPQKGIRSLLWAMHLLEQAESNAYFLIIGDGPSRQELEQYALDVESEQQTRFLGHRPDAASLLHYIDVFWLGSDFEGMSNSLMEAMACGKPSVVSDIPPNRELIRHGQDGWVVNRGDSVGFSQYAVKLFQNADLLHEMGQTAAERMSTEFSIDAMINRYADLLRHEVANRRT